MPSTLNSLIPNSSLPPPGRQQTRARAQKCDRAIRFAACPGVGADAASAIVARPRKSGAAPSRKKISPVAASVKPRATQAPADLPPSRKLCCVDATFAERSRLWVFSASSHSRRICSDRAGLAGKFSAKRSSQGRVLRCVRRAPRTEATVSSSARLRWRTTAWVVEMPPASSGIRAQSFARLFDSPMDRRRSLQSERFLRRLRSRSCSAVERRAARCQKRSNPPTSRPCSSFVAARETWRLQDTFSSPEYMHPGKLGSRRILIWQRRILKRSRSGGERGRAAQRFTRMPEMGNPFAPMRRGEHNNADTRSTRLTLSTAGGRSSRNRSITAGKAPRA